jgi:hypothetical protein
MNGNSTKEEEIDKKKDNTKVTVMSSGSRFNPHQVHLFLL